MYQAGTAIMSKPSAVRGALSRTRVLCPVYPQRCAEAQKMGRDSRTWWAAVLKQSLRERELAYE
jgi:hypothetical protein